jgi:DHA1 family bicyclomycin/chloramphenicol resistance-like MFS transporter
MAAFALILPQATAGAMSPFPDSAGMASSLLGVLQAGAGAVVSAALGLLDDGTQLPMTTAIALAGIGTVLSYFLMVHRLPRR